LEEELGCKNCESLLDAAVDAPGVDAAFELRLTGCGKAAAVAVAVVLAFALPTARFAEKTGVAGFSLV
jgi:hypothetical protein